jgi:SAM-dependent methyltransferase/uncharacterized protein YbaR (Trm112 family)
LYESSLRKIELICPRCRRAGPDGIEQFPLNLNQINKKHGDFVLEGLLGCTSTGCNAVYPIVEGVPVVLKDMKTWWNAQKHSLPASKTGLSELREYFETLETDGASNLTEKFLMSSYMDFHYGTNLGKSETPLLWGDSNQYWEKTIGMAQPDTDATYEKSLDLGCSVGRYTFELARFSDIAVGIDIDFNKVAMAAKIQRMQKVSFERRVRGRSFQEVNIPFASPQNVLFLVADALDPPFRGESFDLVAGLNLVDNVRLPLVLIGQMDALLQSGGRIIIGAPYEWRADICDPVEWLETDEMDSPEMIKGILEGKIFDRMVLSYEIEQENAQVPWLLRNHSRYWSLFLTHLMKARKGLN